MLSITTMLGIALLQLSGLYLTTLEGEAHDVDQNTANTYRKGELPLVSERHWLAYKWKVVVSCRAKEMLVPRVYKPSFKRTVPAMPLI